MCDLHTVEALLVHYGAAGQGFVVLLVTHKCVHTQDGWKTARQNEDGKGRENELRVQKAGQDMSVGKTKIKTQSSNI